MPPIIIRPAISDDIPLLIEMDHGYSTEYVWQMDIHDENGQVTTSFRQARLPRSMRVGFARLTADLKETWTESEAFLIAAVEEQIYGYLGLNRAPVSNTGWIADFAVDRRWRRQGVGTALFSKALALCRELQWERVIVEMQSKNHPAIAFSQKNGLAYCGYSDRYYSNQDIALFFGLTLR